VRVLGDIGDPGEFAGALAHHAADGGAFDETAVVLIDQHAVVMRVGDEEPAVFGHRQACRSAVDAHRRTPAAEILAVGVVDLDAAGHVDQVELVLGVDGDGAGFFELARSEALLAPDEVRRVGRGG
jgi:hypothetical protein